ncbi:hypothetical protein BCR36DRAFT_351391 [Piromyces finnis]|uniref:Alpha/beta-hydrolase n=1 Tax=Piromyces finnis TaxID=1754191 RepID=A0A1Y1VAX5_9FUNG|nr:hypothetical protein BCR36DRAFT_351391 [Piromyces finnis]|eukprot:ORX51513.1 hypothetical protein BCR36DRAFT_351391 [Piromyces finnis]
MKTLDTPNKKIIIDSEQQDKNNLSTPTSQKVRLEMTMEKAEELLSRPESNRTIQLPNGQKVCITESGDPNGIPAIMMSGMGMHSRKYVLLLNNYGVKYKVRIIGFDRPSIDGSDPIYFKKTSRKPKKQIKKKSMSLQNTNSKNNIENLNSSEVNKEKEEKDSSYKLKKGQVDLKVYAEWVEAIIDTLGIQRLHLMSLCIGGLYVLGCVKYFKQPEKIVGPLYLIAPWAKAQKCVTSVRFVDKCIPIPVIRFAMTCYYKLIGYMVPNAKKSPNALMFRLIHVDEKTDPLGGRRLLFSKILKSGFFLNETKQIIHDDWELGFCVNSNNKLDFSIINKDVIIYHGTKDKLIPVKSSKYLIDKWNPNFKAELHLKKGKNHSNIKGSCLNDIFKSIVEHS